MSYNHAAIMSKNKAIYLFIAQQVWSASDIWEEQIIEDIEATDGATIEDFYGITFKTLKGETLLYQ